MWRMTKEQLVNKKRLKESSLTKTKLLSLKVCVIKVQSNQTLLLTQFVIAENNMSIEEFRKKYSNLPPMSEEDSQSGSQSPDIDVESEGDSSGSSEEEDEEGSKEFGLRSLLDDSGDSTSEGDSKTDNDALINDAAAIAESIQPKGNTLSSTSVSNCKIYLFKFERFTNHMNLCKSKS